MLTSKWIYDNKYRAWYYLKSDGSYARNTWQGNYYLQSNGKMAMNQWIYDNNYKAWYYLKSDGSYARNTWQGDYYLEGNGKMATNKWIGKYYVDGSGKWIQTASKNGWVKAGNKWYFFDFGSLLKNKWVGEYYLTADGSMATNTWINGSYVDGSGKRVKTNRHSYENEYFKVTGLTNYAAWDIKKAGNIVRNGRIIGYKYFATNNVYHGGGAGIQVIKAGNAPENYRPGTFSSDFKVGRSFNGYDIYVIGEAGAGFFNKNKAAKISVK